jgi:hypothetical protein
LSTYRYNKPESDLSVVAERMRKEAQDFISMMTAQCEVYFKNMFHRLRPYSAFFCNSFALGRPEVVAKKYNIKMTKVCPVAF